MDEPTSPSPTSSMNTPVPPGVLDRVERLICDRARGTSLERMDLLARRQIAELMVATPLFEKLRVAALPLKRG